VAQETASELWRALRLYCPSLPVTLAQQFIKNRFRDIRLRKLWSWRVGQAQFLTNAVYNAGTVTVVRGSPIVTGVATAWTSDLVGRQFRIGTVAPIYTVAQLNSTTEIVLNDDFGGLSGAGLGYQIFNAYITPTPTDFQDFISVKDTQMNWQLRLHVPQLYVDAIDAQRANSGTPYCLVDLAYNAVNDASGSVGQTARIVGAGPAPFLSGLYTGFTHSIYVITITLGGVVGTAEFTWRKDDGATSTALVTSEQPFEIESGVTVQFPSAVVYVLNDVFAAPVIPGYKASMPMFELWPYMLSDKCYPYLYERRFPDVFEANWALPRFIDGDCLIKGALADISKWPGTAKEKNPMYSLDQARAYQRDFDERLAHMEREDDEVYLTSVRYQMNMAYPNVFFPGADYAQSHEYSA
jgi:hypothetical protein